MKLTNHAGVLVSPVRLLEMLTDRFDVFEVLADSTIKLNRCTSADELSINPLVAEAVLELPTICASPPSPPPAPGPSSGAWFTTGVRQTPRITPESEQTARINSRGPELAAAVVRIRVLVYLTVYRRGAHKVGHR